MQIRRRKAAQQKKIVGRLQNSNEAADAGVRLRAFPENLVLANPIQQFLLKLSLELKKPVTGFVLLS
jgi:hypothetical protein